MKAAARKARIAGSPAAHLTKTALKQSELSGFPEMLQAVGDLMDADGCLLWQEIPGSDLKSSPPKGEFYILADWFRDGIHWSERSLPLDSVTGQAVVTNKHANVHDIQTEPRLERHLHRFFRFTGMKVFCTFPVEFIDGKRGAINVYRKAPTPFKSHELRRMHELAELIPELYRAILSKVSYNLTSEVNRVLWKTERESGGAVIPRELISGVISQIALSIA